MKDRGRACILTRQHVMLRAS